MYKLIIDNFTNQASTRIILRIADNAFIPFDPANTDYANFKYQINHDEAQLQDAEGATMSASEAKAYIATLP